MSSGSIIDRYPIVILLAFTIIIYVGSAGVVPLLDDADSFYAVVAHEMNQRGDWITPYANTLRYLEKPPLFYWLISICYGLFQIESAFTARLPTALAVCGLVYMTYRIGCQLFDRKAGLASGFALSTSIGMFLFTRITLPDALFTLLLSLVLYHFINWLSDTRPQRSLLLMYIFAAIAVLAKGLIGLAFPIGIIVFTLILLGRWREIVSLINWQGILLLLLIAVPWHVLIGERNPGFYWFYFVNEHVLRFLGKRYPMDYGTVPLIPFWLLHIVWLFPWSAYLLTIFSPVNFRHALNNHRQAVIFLLCWAGTILLFFSFSSRLEYYTVPAFPALALLAGRQFTYIWDRHKIIAPRLLTIISLIVGISLLIIAGTVTATTSEGWLNLKDNPDLYRYYLGHIFDLTPESLLALRTPLILAGIAFGVLIPLHYKFSRTERKAMMLGAAMSVLFLAATIAFLIFSPRLSSKAIADQIVRYKQAIPIVIDGEYEEGCSVAFYTGRPVIMHNGRSSNLEYGSRYADAPKLFIDSAELSQMWAKNDAPIFILTFQSKYQHLQKLLSLNSSQTLYQWGDKLLLTNQPAMIK